MKNEKNTVKFNPVSTIWGAFGLIIILGSIIALALNPQKDPNPIGLILLLITGAGLLLGSLIFGVKD